MEEERRCGCGCGRVLVRGPNETGQNWRNREYFDRHCAAKDRERKAKRRRNRAERVNAPA